MVPDGATAYRIEGMAKDGDWEHGPPLLNPRRPASSLSFERLRHRMASPRAYEALAAILAGEREERETFPAATARVRPLKLCDFARA